MKFENHTPFVGLSWEHIDSSNTPYLVSVCRIKFRLEELKDSEFQLVLDSNQGELFGKDVFFDDSNDTEIRYTSDYAPFKPLGDVILNTCSYSNSPFPINTWNCGIKIISSDNQIIKEKALKITGSRQWIRKNNNWHLTSPQISSKVPIKYTLAYGGEIQITDTDSQNNILVRYDKNPIGCGLLHKEHPKDTVQAPQIESPSNPLNPKEPYKEYTYEGFGNIDKTWDDRFVYGGTYDDEWLKNQHPLLPKDFDYMFYQTSHPSMRIKNYIQPNTKFILENLLPNKSICSFEIPSYNITNQIISNTQTKSINMHIDTVVVDIYHDDPSKWCVYLSYRSRYKTDEQITKSTIFVD